MHERATRRQFLAAAGAAGAALGAGAPAAGAAGAALGAGAPAAGTAETTPSARTLAAAADAERAGAARVGFYGAHQAGIATPTQEHVHFLALDVVGGSETDLRALLAALSAAAARLTAGKPIGALRAGPAPPADTGEAVGLGPSRLTITFGLGPGLFQAGRFGLNSRRPAPLVELPSFANDSLEPSICQGDIAVQACAEDPQVAFHAVHDLIRVASPTAVPRWSLAGFSRTRNTAGQPTPRNLFGFKEGTGNIVSQDQAALQRFVWAGAPDSPAWMEGGSYMVVRRIQMLMHHWDSVSLDQQERTFGRHKLSGAPLGKQHEFDPIDLNATTHGRLAISRFAHIRLASPEYNNGQRILRRGYSYSEGIYDGALAAGQLFICFQRDPRAQFIPMQTALALNDLLNEHTKHIGSAIFACPPGAQRGGFVGQSLFD